MQVNEHTDDGFYYRSWLAEKPKAAILLIHGLGEHCQRYDHLGAALTKQGYSLYSMDLPGHGKSPGPRGHVDDFSVFQDTTLSLFNSVQTQAPEIPKFIIGHSMGGLIVSRFLLEHQALFSGALLSGPAIQSPQEPPAWQVSLIRLIAKITPKAKMLGLDASGVSRDPVVVEKYMADPLISKEKLTAKFLVEMTDTMETVKQRASEITLPILLMHGSADSMTAPEGTRLLHDSCASLDKKMTLYDGLYHEIFNEPEQEQVFTDMIAWLNTHTSS